MKSLFSKSLLFSLVALLSFSIKVSALQQQTNGVTYMAWQEIETLHPLPSHPISIVASTDSNAGDFVAMAKDAGDAGFYFLDHAHRDLGWQKQGTFFQAEVKGLYYGLHRFFAFGIDRQSKQPVVATSSDHGKTWTQNIIIGGTGYYDNAVFSDKIGVATGKDGAIATTGDGIAWKEVAPPSGTPKKIFCSMVSPGDAKNSAKYEFLLLETLPTHQYGFLVLKDFPIEPTISSADGLLWNYSNYFPISSNQYLMKENSMFLVGGSNYWYTSFTNITKILPGDFQALDPNDSMLPLIEIADCISCGNFFVGVGIDSKTGHYVSLLTPLQQLGGCNMISVDFFSKKVMAVAGCQNGFVAIAEDGTSYYSPYEVAHAK